MLIAPLNWGLGHASRCVPIINRLKAANEVILGSDGLAYEWLRTEFPELEMIQLPSYNIKYDQSTMWISMFRQAPKIRRAIQDEKEVVNTFIELNSIDLIISDHRLGVRNKKAKSVLIAHQLLIPHRNRLISYGVSMLHRYLINRFDECWVPDDANSSLTGKMSQLSLEIPKLHIGPLSRLRKISEAEILYDAVIILSGPEPQRTYLEESIIKSIAQLSSYRFAVVRGLKEELPLPRHTNAQIIQMANTQQMNHLINATSTVICRSGYSSVMDMIHLEQKAILIPTPNQPEQTYLADHLAARSNFVILHQNEINPKNILNCMKSLAGKHLNKSGIF